MRRQHRIRIVTAISTTALVLAGATGCGALRETAKSSSSTPSAAVADPATVSAPPTYNSDATGEVVGTDCRYDKATQQFKYDISIQNASPDTTFTYSFNVAFTGGDSAFDDENFGSQYEKVTVGAGLDRKFTVTQGYSMTRRTYYGCQVAQPTKALAG